MSTILKKLYIFYKYEIYILSLNVLTRRHKYIIELIVQKYVT